MSFPNHAPSMGIESIGRLEAPSISKVSSEEFWAKLNRIVQVELEKLVSDVRRQYPEVFSREFFTPSRTIPLNSYREFRLGTDIEKESIIAGVCYRNNLGRFVLNCDICGEESGATYFDSGDYEIGPLDLEEIEVRTRLLASDLSKHAEDVILGLQKSFGGD